MATVHKLKTAPLSEYDLRYLKNKQRHSFPKSQEPKVTKCLKKHLLENEEIDFKFSTIGGSYATINAKRETLGGRWLFCRIEKDMVSYLYDADSLINDWESNSSREFKTFGSNDPYIYLHLAIAYQIKGCHLEECSHVLKEFIKRNPDARGKKVAQTIEDYAWLFVAHFYGFAVFGSCYLDMGMLEESAIVSTAFANHDMVDEDKKEEFAGHAYFYLGQFSKARIALAKLEERYAKVEHPSSDGLNLVRFQYYWALGMEKWEEGATIDAYKAIQIAKRLTKSGDPEEKLMTYLEGAINAGNNVVSMAQQISLLNMWRENTHADEKLVKEREEHLDGDEVNNLLLGEIRRVKDAIFSMRASGKLKGIILKAILSDEHMKGMLENLVRDRKGAITRYMSDWSKKLKGYERKIYEKTVITSFSLIRSIYESHITDKLREHAEQALHQKLSDEEFNIAYLEAKDEFIERGNKIYNLRVGRAVKKQFPLTKKFQKSAKPETAVEYKYKVILSSKNGVATETPLEATAQEVQDKFLKEKIKRNIFIFNRSVFKRVRMLEGDHEKKNVVPMNLDDNVFRLLILFLRYKDEPLSALALYHVAWKDSAEYDEKAAVIDAIMMGRLKQAVTQLRREFEDVNGFCIPPALGRGKRKTEYLLQGHFSFCVIYDRNDEKKYTLPAEKAVVTHNA